MTSEESILHRLSIINHGPRTGTESIMGRAHARETLISAHPVVQLLLLLLLLLGPFPLALLSDLFVPADSFQFKQEHTRPSALHYVPLQGSDRSTNQRRFEWTTCGGRDGYGCEHDPRPIQVTITEMATAQRNKVHIHTPSKMMVLDGGSQFGVALLRNHKF